MKLIPDSAFLFLSAARALSRAFAMRASMSRKGDCWDNAVDEIMAWIARYNHARLHSTLGFRSPMTYEKKWLAQHEAHAA